MSILLALIAKDNRQVLWTPANLTTPPIMWENNTSAVAFDLGGNLIHWDDLSGNSNNWRTNTAANPSTVNPTWVTGQNSLKVVRFNNANSQILQGQSANTITANQTGFHIFIAGAPTKNSGSLQRFCVFSVNGSGNVRCGMYIGSNNVEASQRRLDANSAVNAVMTQPDSLFHIYSSEHDWTAATVGIRLDGGTITSAATGQGSGATSNTTSTDVGLMGSQTTGSQYASGDIGEFIALQYVAGTSDRQKIEGYLAWRWGIEANLPSGHPYKSAPPYV